MIAAYLLLAACLSWPLASAGGLVGYPNVDATDTVALRGLVADLLASPGGAWVSDGAYFPAGYPVLKLTPNLADHLTGAPLAALGFPLGDRLWWWLVLAAVGAAGHRLGRQLGGGHGAGALAGVALLSSEAVLREANLHHAPQVMAAIFAPLYLAALLRATGPEARPRDAVMTGGWMAAAALTYWYQGLFLALGGAPIALARWRRPRAAAAVAVSAAVALALAGGPLAWTLARQGELPEAPTAASVQQTPGVPAERQLAFAHGVDLALPLRMTPADRSNGVALVLALACAAAALRERRAGRRPAWSLLGVAAVGAVMALGPYLKWGEALAGGRLIPLPFEALSSLHPALARLTWPERWGILIPLGLAAFAARAPRAAWWIPPLLLEGLLRSQNLPLQVTDLRHEEHWADLAAADGAVLELPLSRGWRAGSLPGRHRRWHGRPVVNPLLLPPGHHAPEAWVAWTHAQPLVAGLLALEAGQSPPPPGAAEAAALAAEGVGVIALDRLGAGLTEGQRLRYLRWLRPALGAPEDRGAYDAWWLRPAAPPPPPDDPDAWREALRRRLAPPPPELDTLIQPTWLVAPAERRR